MIGCIWFNGHDIENHFVDANEMVKIGRDIGHQIGGHFNGAVKMATIGRDAKRLVKCHARAQRCPQALAFSSKGEKLLDNDWRAGYAGLCEQPADFLLSLFEIFRPIVDNNPVLSGCAGKDLRAAVCQVISIGAQRGGDDTVIIPLPGSSPGEPAGLGKRAGNQWNAIPSLWVVFRRAPQIEEEFDPINKFRYHMKCNNPSCGAL